jgi:cytochrome oxidase Cu insertion factor (SCO1/SenC/PrrC family)
MSRPHLRTALPFLLLLTLVAARVASPQNVKITHTALKAGDMAPDFTLLDNHWNPIHLSDFRGKKNVVLAFYVLAFSEG